MQDGALTDGQDPKSPVDGEKPHSSLASVIAAFAATVAAAAGIYNAYGSQRTTMESNAFREQTRTFAQFVLTAERVLDIGRFGYNQTTVEILGRYALPGKQHVLKTSLAELERNEGQMPREIRDNLIAAEASFGPIRLVEELRRNFEYCINALSIIRPSSNGVSFTITAHTIGGGGREASEADFDSAFTTCFEPRENLRLELRNFRFNVGRTLATGRPVKLGR